MEDLFGELFGAFFKGIAWLVAQMFGDIASDAMGEWWQRSTKSARELAEIRAEMRAAIRRSRETRK